VTEQMTVHHRLEDVLGAISLGLVANVPDTALVRIGLYTTARECAVCRRGPPAAAPSGDDRSLHLCATAGIFAGVEEPHHRAWRSASCSAAAWPRSARRSWSTTSPGI
jgi:hypothetical protein